MDIACDHIQEETLSPEAPPDKGNEQKEGDPEKTRERATSNDLQTELSEAYKSFSQSSWGTALGGLWGDVRKRGETYLETARQELEIASNSAPKGAQDPVNPTGTLTINPDDAGASDKQPPSQQNTAEGTPHPTKRDDVPESLPADIVKEAESMFLSFRTTAASRLKQVQKAEDAADEALLKFGVNIKDYLRDAVKITAPDGTDAKDGGKGGSGSVLFESKDAEGRRVVHATRFDAQLHVIHCTPTTFSKDPESEEYARWKEEFDVEKKTDAIAADLNKYPELRKAMEKLVPEQVEYPEFWRRYYFLRHVVETEEQKRRELLKGTKQLNDEEEIGWGEEDEDDDDTQKTTPATPKPNTENTDDASKSDDTSGKEQQEERRPSSNDQHLKPGPEGRKSNENSVGDSDTSYDIVSGATSRTPGSPKEETRKRDRDEKGAAGGQSDEDDWE